MFQADKVFTGLKNRKDYFTNTTVFEFLEATQAKKTSLQCFTTHSLLQYSLSQSLLTTGGFSQPDLTHRGWGESVTGDSSTNSTSIWGGDSTSGTTSVIISQIVSGEVSSTVWASGLLFIGCSGLFSTGGGTKVVCIFRVGGGTILTCSGGGCCCKLIRNFCGGGCCMAWSGGGCCRMVTCC